MPIHDGRRDAAWQAANPDAVKQAIEAAKAGDALQSQDPNGQMGYQRQLEARRDHDTWDRLPSLTMPVFLAGGKYDRQAPPENMELLQIASQAPASSSSKAATASPAKTRGRWSASRRSWRASWTSS